jgi:diacylglycerol kinase (ATP)
MPPLDPELAHSAIDTLARSLGDPQEQGLKVAREIATAGVLVAVVASAALAVAIFTLRLGDLFSWW